MSGGPIRTRRIFARSDKRLTQHRAPELSQTIRIITATVNLRSSHKARGMPVAGPIHARGIPAGGPWRVCLFGVTTDHPDGISGTSGNCWRRSPDDCDADADPTGSVSFGSPRLAAWRRGLQKLDRNRSLTGEYATAFQTGAPGVGLSQRLVQA